MNKNGSILHISLIKELARLNGKGTEISLSIPTISPSILKNISKLAGFHDPFVSEHGEKVAEISILLAAAGNIEFDPIKIRLLWYAAIIHDIGKLGIPKNILNLSRKFTPEEYKLIQSHTTISCEFFIEIGINPLIMNVIRFHHERFDGFGYPDKLFGVDIPIEARIVAISDVYDALTHKRTYRNAFTHKDAFSIMKKEVGHFDPHLLDVFFGMEEMLLAL